MKPLFSAVILAAGESRRMGEPKLLLPWGKATVLGQVIATFAAAGIDEIIVVTGGARQQVEALVEKMAKEYSVRAVYNPQYASGGMLTSIQAGLREARGAATLVALGDQPQVREETVRRICAAFARTESPLIIPSFGNRRGHPWLAARPLWPEILALPASTTPRRFLNDHTGQIEYVEADESILQDLDTPEEYRQQRP